MSSPFNPLIAKVATSKELLATSMRLKVINRTEADGFLGRTPSSAATPAHHHPDGGAEPVVTLQREGDKVVGVRIVCSCGQVTELACVY